ncbi:MAG: hypothetical protein J6328_00590, partial [Bacilli bacterium]|nr:hypothetical protein [Bacilli bacterium]
EVTATGSTYKGKLESIRVTFDAFDAETFTGASGDLIINKAGEQVVSITLAGAPLDRAMLDEDGNVFVAGTATVDNTDPLAPTKSSTDTVYELDKVNGTYVINSKNVNKPIFHEVTGTCVVTDYVEKDGNLWIEFTAPSDGEISVDELVASTTDNYIQIFESTTAGNFASSKAKATSDYGGTASGGGKINDFVVQSGKTYIIKAGHYYDKDKDVTGTSAKPIALESVSFTWNAYTTDVYTSGDGADLTISKKGDTILSIKLGEETLNGAVLNEDGNIVVGLGLAAGDDGNYYDAYYVYVLNDEDHTYALEKLSIPYASSENFTITPVVGDYGFDENAGSYTSNNAGQHNSDATMTIEIEEDGIISFDYDVSSEGAYTIWDYLEISVNGRVVDGYAKVGGEAGKSGKFLLEVSAGDVITLKYHKDGSGNGGRDNAIISNIVLLVVPAESGQE